MKSLVERKSEDTKYLVQTSRLEVACYPKMIAAGKDGVYKNNDRGKVLSSNNIHLEGLEFRAKLTAQTTTFIHARTGKNILASNTSSLRRRQVLGKRFYVFDL